MLTTTDNPFNPFDEFDEWRRWDEDAGYHTLPYLARITRSSDELSLADQDAAVEWAIDEIVTENINGMYKKVTTETETKQSLESV